MSAAQQRACDDWTTNFNHVRPHEGIGQQMPGELYRASERRPGRVVVGGYPDGCRLVDVGQSGSINCDGWKLYLSHALGGYAVGLQGFERGYRVWFFHVLLGTFILSNSFKILSLSSLISGTTGFFPCRI
jgi:hypothetical protein